MSIWGAFTNSSMAMMAQSTALGAISQNVGNVNTVGYKKTDSQFATLLSETTPQFDFFGVQANQRTLIDQQGMANSTGKWSDVALSGEGFFIVNSEVDGSGETLFTRDGSFVTKAMDGDGDGVDEAYLVNSSGYFLQGWQASAAGTITPTGTLGSLSSVYIEPNTLLPGVMTTTAWMQGNIPAGADTEQDLTLTVYDADFEQQALVTKWTPGATGNTWTLSFEATNGTVTSPPIDVVFDGNGNLVSPTNTTVDITWAGGPASLALDLSGISQLSGPLILDASGQNGTAEAYLARAEFNKNGELIGHYTNGDMRTLYALPIATFVAPNSLEARSGTMFAATELAGDMSIQEVGGGTSLVASAVEMSNVDLADEFTKMIVTQKAYSSAATVFRTADEMTQGARDLKR